MTTLPRTFVTDEFNPADFETIQPFYNALLEREIGSPSELEAWLLDASELYAAIREYSSRTHIEYSCHTEDAEKEQAFMNFVENVQPRLSPLSHEMHKKYVACPFRAQLETTPRLAMLGKQWQEAVELFREQNIPLFTQITKLNTEYDKISGAMMVEFRGETYTQQQMGRFLEDPNRATRQEAWELANNRRLAERQSLDDIFDKMLDLRAQVAANADCDNYRTFIWKAMERFDYTPADCLTFADAIEAAVVPRVDDLNQKRKAELGVDTVRPWDISVDPKSRPALRPFDQKDVEGFVSKTRGIFQRVDPRLGELFGELKMGRNLDLDSRKAKRPGGYQSSLEESREPFIFMNAAGLQRDVVTMLHEGGHAFHYQAARDEPLVFLRHAPLEFCEVASMSMELLGGPHWDEFYDEADHARALRTHLEGIIKFFPWMATIDTFQHWLYAESADGKIGRTEHWLGICDRFGAGIDWTGYESIRECLWQRQLHLYHVPFYYVEYGIAQLGALQVWQNYKQDPKQALAQLLEAFALGGTRPLPELFETAGIRFDFSADTLGPLMAMVQEELAKLPA